MRWCIVIAIATAAIASDAVAQRTTTSVDLGGANVRYGDSVTTSVMSVTPAFHARWDRATLSAVGSYSALTNDAWSMDGSVDASLYSRSAHGFVGELSGSGAGAMRSAGAGTGRWAGLTRAHYMTDVFGAYVGAGVGGANDGLAWHRVRQAEAGVWGRRAGWTMLTSWSPEIVDDTIHFADSQAAVRWEGERVEAGLTGGARSGSRFLTTGGTGRTWASASLVVRLTSHAAVAGSAGTYPVDLAEGFPGGRFASLAIRFATPHARTSNPRDSASGAARRDAETPRTVTAFQVQSAGSGRWTLRVRAPGARAVELNGDFTGWKPVALAAGTDGWWATTLAIAPGIYQTNVRVDGGPWLAPPGLVAVRDEFGGAFGVLTVR
jgi:hypothetical protein